MKISYILSRKEKSKKKMGLIKFVEPKQYFLIFGVNICSSYRIIQPSFQFQRSRRLSMLILLFFPHMFPTSSQETHTGKQVR